MIIFLAFAVAARRDEVEKDSSHFCLKEKARLCLSAQAGFSI